MIAKLFYILFFTVPLVLFPQSSELFEFNKMVTVYVFTVLIVATWLSRCLVTKKFIFRRTILDLPILLFLGALALSTIFSIDIRTSIFGYYSRFHGGLLSYLCYSLLYWAYVSNMNKKTTLITIYSLLTSAFLVSVYGILQRFGIDKDVWVQDVQNRIFSSLGQPNWLAAWMVALVPLTWAFGLNTKYEIKSAKFWLWTGLSVLFFIILLFTKSRSGLLGFVIADIIFWSFTFWRFKKIVLSSFIIHHSLFAILVLAIGTPFQVSSIEAPISSSMPALETGGTESGEIRKIVWAGAIDLWKKYPILGTGPETFAYSYYETRPVKHNLVSEWDFLYNKAHNEYLNFAATTGTVGLGAYFILIIFAIYQILNSNHQSRNSKQYLNSNFKNLKHLNLFRDSDFVFRISLLAGFASILVTNFFGFSVVPVALLFFMFPALAVSLTAEHTTKFSEHRNLNIYQKMVVFFVLCTMFYALYRISVYWQADFLYEKGRHSNDAGKFATARDYLTQATSLSPKEPVYWIELSRSSVGLVGTNPNMAKIAISEGQRAISLSPRNLNLQRSMASIFIKLAGIEPSYLSEAKQITENAIIYSPTDAKLFYNLGLTTYRLGQTLEALEIFEKTIEMKSNYKNARFARALILIELNRHKEAKEELSYILEKIDPNDTLVKEELEKI